MACRTSLASRLVLVAFGSSVAIAGCERKAEPPAAPKPAAAPAVVAPPPPPLPPPPMGRAEFLKALESAASAYAGGPEAAPDLAGRRFLIRQAFGCMAAGPAEAASSDGRAQATSGDRNASIVLSLQPADWTDEPMVAHDETAWEAVEGFWLPRPWLRGDGCPAPQADPDPSLPAPQPSPQTAGLAAVFEHGSSRLARRDGRAFRHVIRGEAPVQLPAGGYRLVLEGRFVAFPDGRALRCTSPSREVRPVCVAAAVIDRIAFEEAGGDMLSEWRPG